jgi:hypothetical protein
MKSRSRQGGWARPASEPERDRLANRLSKPSPPGYIPFLFFGCVIGHAGPLLASKCCSITFNSIPAIYQSCVGLAIMSQKVASTDANAGNPKPNQVQNQM